MITVFPPVDTFDVLKDHISRFPISFLIHIHTWESAPFFRLTHFSLRRKKLRQIALFLLYILVYILCEMFFWLILSNILKMRLPHRKICIFSTTPASVPSLPMYRLYIITGRSMSPHHTVQWLYQSLPLLVPGYSLGCFLVSHKLLHFPWQEVLCRDTARFTGSNKFRSLAICPLLWATADIWRLRYQP